MNIFYLDADPEIAAKYCCDKHCVKMILESAQLLCTARALSGGLPIDGYSLKPTHVNHPSAKWVRESKAHYKWLYRHLKALCKEYTRRYGKVHKVERERLLQALEVVPDTIPMTQFSDPPQCMPEEYKSPRSTVEAYRKYYIKDKAKFAKWKTGEIPSWFV